MWAAVEVLAAAMRMVRGAAAAVQDGRGRRGDGGATEGRRRGDAAAAPIGLTDIGGCAGGNLARCRPHATTTETRARERRREGGQRRRRRGGGAGGGGGAGDGGGEPIGCVVDACDAKRIVLADIN
jgi:hypothetical protein